MQPILLVDDLDSLEVGTRTHTDNGNALISGSRSRQVAMKKAVDSFLHSLPDFGLAGFGATAAGSRHDHLRGNEIKELTGADSRIHFAQPAASNLFIKIMRK